MSHPFVRTSFALWLASATIAGLAAVGVQACNTSHFNGCQESRTCASGGDTDVATAAGASGEAPAQKDGGSPNGGAAGETANTSESAGAAGEAEPSCGAPGDPCCAGDRCVVGAACSGNTCSCTKGLSECAAGCADLGTDAKNCGACGHDCLGGACDLGKCQPVLIAPDQTYTSDVATDGTYVYWSGAADELTKHNYIARRRVDLSDDVKVIVPDEPYVSGLTVSASGVYWLGTDHLRTCDAPNCSKGPADFAPTVSSCLKLLFSASVSTFYWACPAGYAVDDGSLWKLSAGASSPVRVEPKSPNPDRLTSDEQNVYWFNSSNFDGQGDLKADGAVWRVRLSDGLTTKLVSNIVAEGTAMAVAGTALYVAGRFDGTTPAADATAIFKIPLPNGAVKPLKFADATSVGGMVADPQALYWTDYGGGLIARCAHTGCTAPEVLAPNQTQPDAIAQDSTSIYWISVNAKVGPVQRLAK